MKTSWSAPATSLSTPVISKVRAASRFSLNGHSFGGGGVYNITDTIDTSFGAFIMIDEAGKNRMDNIELHVWDIVGRRCDRFLVLGRTDCCR